MDAGPLETLWTTIGRFFLPRVLLLSMNFKNEISPALPNTKGEQFGADKVLRESLCFINASS